MTTELELEIFEDLQVCASGPDQVGFLEAQFEGRAVYKFCP